MITDYEVLEEVIALAKANPEAIYDNDGDCAYTYGPVMVKNREISQGCIVGQAILKLDPDLVEELGHNDHDDVKTLFESATWIKLTDREVIEKLDRIQVCQDAGDSWGKAIAEMETR